MSKPAKPLDVNDMGRQLSVIFERILKEYGNIPAVRLAIAQYTMGYMGVAYGLHIPE